MLLFCTKTVPTDQISRCYKSPDSRRNLTFVFRREFQEKNWPQFVAHLRRLPFLSQLPSSCLPPVLFLLRIGPWSDHNPYFFYVELEHEGTIVVILEAREMAMRPVVSLHPILIWRNSWPELPQGPFFFKSRKKNQPTRYSLRLHCFGSKKKSGLEYSQRRPLQYLLRIGTWSDRDPYFFYAGLEREATTVVILEERIMAIRHVVFPSRPSKIK